MKSSTLTTRSAHKYEHSHSFQQGNLLHVLHAVSKWQRVSYYCSSYSLCSLKKIKLLCFTS